MSELGNNEEIFKIDGPPAKPGDVVVKKTSHYYSELQDGSHYVVLDVLSGDSAAVVMSPSGEMATLSYPEEYRVVTNIRALVGKFRSESMPPKQAEQPTGDSYMNRFKKK